MKALYYPDFEKLTLADLAIPEPGVGEVLLRVAACGLCGSELETFKSKSPRRKPPLVMGHEFCGTVERLGPEPSSVRLNQRVVSNSLVSCGSCLRCKRGDTHLCGARQIFGMHRPGAFAEYVVVPESSLIRWPENVTASEACLAEPLANGVHMVNLTKHVSVETALVIGAGPIGLMAQQALQAMRGARVMVCDLSPARLNVAKRLGASEVFVSNECNVIEEVLARTGGEGVDLVIDAAGSSATKRLSLEALRPGGAAVWIGLHSDRIDLASYAITLPEKQVLGTYAAKMEELEYALSLMERRVVDVSSWVDIFPIDCAVEGFFRMLQPDEGDLKGVFTF